MLIEVGESADGHCKGCLKDWQNAYRQNNREKLNAKRRAQWKEKYVPHPKPERAECGKGHTYAITGRYADGHCAECRRESDRDRAKQKQRQISESTQLQSRRRDYYRDSSMQRRYGLKKGEYQKMLDAQHGLCAVCEQPETTVRKGTLMNLSVDHCHKTGHKRGLLCNRCNRALGLLDDDPALIQKLLHYLSAA